MTYPYSNANRLFEHHKYMYTPFRGKDLLRAYRADRIEVIYAGVDGEQGTTTDMLLLEHALLALLKHYDSYPYEGAAVFAGLLESAKIVASKSSVGEVRKLAPLVKYFDSVSLEKSVTTLDLLNGIVVAQLTGCSEASAKIWIDLLVKRFEITKKLYELYQPGFKKGEKKNNSVQLYWLFALALILFYVKTEEEKYLNTILKVCDLLSSLPQKILQGHIPKHGLAIVFAAEIACIDLLARKKGVNIEVD